MQDQNGSIMDSELYFYLCAHHLELTCIFIPHVETLELCIKRGLPPKRAPTLSAHAQDQVVAVAVDR